MSTHETIDWTGRVLEVRIEGPAHGGEFVARHDGRVIFCRGGLTGERVEVRVDDDPGRGFCRGTVQTVIEASDGRVEPTCPAAAAGGGCCDWSHIAPATARDLAGRVLAEQAGRIGRFEPPHGTVAVDVPAGDDTRSGWRTVARWFTDDDARPGVRRLRSREIVSQPCSQPDPRVLDAVLGAGAGVGPRREVLGVLGDDGTVHVAHRAAETDVRRGRGRASGRAAATRARARTAAGRRWELALGGPMVERRVGSRRWLVPVDAFWQAHRSAASHYSDLVGAAVADAPGVSTDPVVWDLYGGAGVFGAAARDAFAGAHITVVESAQGSLTAATETLGADAGIHTVRSRVETFLESGPTGTTQSTENGARPVSDAADIVILDPPRGGAGIPVMQVLASATRSRIIHVGCDPASLARDVGVLVSAGWQLRDLRGVAAFPGTHHVEGVAVLDAPGRT